jgi:hypothetical protein
VIVIVGDEIQSIKRCELCQLLVTLTYSKLRSSLDEKKMQSTNFMQNITVYFSPTLSSTPPTVQL